MSDSQKIPSARSQVLARRYAKRAAEECYSNPRFREVMERIIITHMEQAIEIERELCLKDTHAAAQKAARELEGEYGEVLAVLLRHLGVKAAASSGE